MASRRVHAFVAVVFLAFIVGMINPVSGDLATITMSASPSTVTVTAGSSASTTVTVHLTPPTATESGYPVIECVGLPFGASCSNNIAASPVGPPTCVGFTDGYQFTLTVSAGSSTIPGSYSVNVVMTSISLTGCVAIIQPYPFETSSADGSGFGPSSLIPRQTSPSVPITIIVSPATPIPEYSFGLPLLAILMLAGYVLIRRVKTPDRI